MTCGLTWSLTILIIGLFAWIFALDTSLMNTMSSLYVGFKPTWLGSLIGASLGFVDGFVGGLLIAGFYRLFLKTAIHKEK